MVILADTREQRPLPFREGGAIEGVEKVTLSYGDYAVRYRDGSSPPVRFERKGMGDLYGTMTTGYPRFKKEMERARSDGASLILAVEGSLSDVLEGHRHSSWSGDSMTQKLFTLMVRYKMDVVFCVNRLEMARFISEYFQAIGREREIMKKAGKLS